MHALKKILLAVRRWWRGSPVPLFPCSPVPPSPHSDRLRRAIESPDANLVVIVKGIERYIWIFDNDHLDAAIASAGRYADNPETSLTWADATRAAVAMRDMARRH